MEQQRSSSSAVCAVVSNLDAHIGKTLRLNAKHLPWATAQAILAQQQTWRHFGAVPDRDAEVEVYELEEGCWRIDVTAANIAAAAAAGWTQVHRLLVIAHVARCEALELSPEHLALPDEQQMPLFTWP